ncbi:helicase-related protein [Methanobrevibacter curvatus]|uniref:RNA polymerase-associated protein RapA n=1 Tax=Methanobrevibacter curvatus TaxID=49547 RepID=A0A165ZSM0_9EURY|nr:helicase-related protein [Methanobrevibacter curvatus]KZX11108.1 RNA polymerase-associated protein RapA [Methanobrevibacter curvatus]
MSTDTTFITNEENNKLVDRFNDLIKDTEYFDCLVGYFYTSGFYKLYKSLKNTEKIRILVGISTDKHTYNLIQKSKMTLSHSQTKEKFSNKIKDEIDNSKDSLDVETGIKKFIEWLKSGKLEIKAYRDGNIHAKLYISTFSKSDRDKGRVITGSSNFTKSGLQDNLEFNVELKDSSDYEFAIKKFDGLWEEAVDVSDPYVETITKKTWLNDEITPYELFLKFLYEYFKEDINLDLMKNVNREIPEEFMDLEYQWHAVVEAKKKIATHGGVFLSDVVGLGKTYMGIMLAKELRGKTLVIAPPNLLKRSNPGSWTNASIDFNYHLEPCSKGKLEHLLKDGHEKYDTVIIDEAHEFRNENTVGYDSLYKICRGKRVILVTATPYNNSPSDILAQLKLFQNAHNSTLPNPKVRDLENYFNNILKNLVKLKNKNQDEYLESLKEYSKDIRENVLRHVMVRRTRTGIIKYYSKDLEKQDLSFPDVNDPVSVIYELDDKLDKVFNETLKKILEELNYSRYTPLLYLNDTGELNKVKGPQINMGKFMKTLLFKRLESSFQAFKKSIGRFIYAYEKFIETFNDGNVYISKKKINKIYQYIDEENFEKIDDLVEKGDAETYSTDKFNKQFIIDLQSDLATLKEIEKLWKDVDNDPKLNAFIEKLENDKNLQNKVVVFTESEETMRYLVENLNPKFDNKVFGFAGSSPSDDKYVIIDNFDGNAHDKKDDYRILITTEVLSQGMNLHQANVVVNYDIPWNPTRMMQRVGRVQRVNTSFKEIFIYNFFPASHISEHLSLEDAAKSKLEAFIEMLGTDSKLLADEEIQFHELFSKLNSKESIVGEEEVDLELEYLNFIRNIRDDDKKRELWEKIKKLPKKARSSKKTNNGKIKNRGLFTFFRKGPLTKTYLNKGDEVIDLDFEGAIEILKAEENTKREKISKDFYKLLYENKKEFGKFFKVENEEPTKMSKNDKKLRDFLMALKGYHRFTDEEVEKCNSYIDLIDEGSISKKSIKNTLQEIKNIKDKNEFRIYQTISNNLDEFMYVNTRSVITGNDKPKEIILSEYLIKE